MDSPGVLVWPGGVIPKEVFDEIIQHLHVSDVRNLRLVCREFYEKTSANLVHTLATRFKPEFPRPVSSPLPGYGQTLFINYGHHVRRFSLCLEVDEDELSCPPIQPDQKLVPSYWGLHLWPNGEHGRHSDLTRLETAADDVMGIKQALRPLENVMDIAISCDPGWGRLLGPERRLVAARVSRDHCQVIGLPTMCDRAPSPHTPLPVTPRPFPETATIRRQLMLKKMIQEAGVTLEDTDPARQHIEAMALYPGQAPTLSLKESQPGLRPNKLNTPQGKFVLEFEWATRALVQSWAVALMDLSRSGGFRHLVCLRFAKISSSHLTILTSQRFWESLSYVKEVHLQVLADWRLVRKTASIGGVIDHPVEPVGAVTKAFPLLQLISQQRNITAFHFEWLCGGELSWGSQRGRYILPAPFTRRPHLMVMRETVSRREDLLSFPHVVSLSLKNCWFTPHIFSCVMSRMARDSLENLKLESVSLSGGVVPAPLAAWTEYPLTSLLWRMRGRNRHPPLPIVEVPELPNNPLAPNLAEGLGPEPIPFQGPVAPNPTININPGPDVQGLYGPEAIDLVLLPHGEALAPGPNPDATPAPAPAELVRIPCSSWPSIIDALSSGPKTTKMPGHNRNESEVPDRPGPTISSMEFKSCGYVAVESCCIDSSRLGTWRFFADHYRWTTCEVRAPEIPSASHEGSPMQATESGQEELKNEAMQVSWSDLNGWVSPVLPGHETEVLRDVFGMRIGWDGVYDAQTVAIAKAVNPNEPGQGRFSGVVSEKTS